MVSNPRHPRGRVITRRPPGYTDGLHSPGCYASSAEQHRICTQSWSSERSRLSMLHSPNMSNMTKEPSQEGIVAYSGTITYYRNMLACSCYCHIHPSAVAQESHCSQRVWSYLYKITEENLTEYMLKCYNEHFPEHTGDTGVDIGLHTVLLWWHQLSRHLIILLNFKRQKMIHQYHH